MSELNNFEAAALDVVGSAETVAPVFVHSPQGVLILNASELLLGAIWGLIHRKHAADAAKKAAAPASTQVSTDVAQKAAIAAAVSKHEALSGISGAVSEIPKGQA
jgi:hypothetical protein